MSRLLLIVLFVACSREPLVPEPTDKRQPIETGYVSAAEMKVYAKPDDNSPVIIKYQTSESVPILARKGDWIEVRTGDTSGWAHASDLGSAEQAKQQEDDPMARFQRGPGAVTNLTAKGELYIEADVNTDGDVVATRLIANTTGSDALAAQNEAALRQAKFIPMVVGGTRKPFKYYHRVIY